MLSLSTFSQQVMAIKAQTSPVRAPSARKSSSPSAVRTAKRLAMPVSLKEGRASLAWVI